MPVSAGAARKVLLFWGTAAAIIGLDVVTKAWAENRLLPHVPVRVVGDVVRFTLAYNPGAAFSISVGDYSRLVFGAVAVAALLALWSIYRSAHPAEQGKIVAAALVWAGAFGNLLDRLRSPRGVVDFIDVGIGTTRFWTFNVADSAVTVGAILLAWALWREDRREPAAAGRGRAPDGGVPGTGRAAGAPGGPADD